MAPTLDQFDYWYALPEEMRQLVYEFAYGGTKKPIIGKARFDYYRNLRLTVEAVLPPPRPFEPAVNQFMVSKEFFRDAAAAFCKAIVLDDTLHHSVFRVGFGDVLKCRLLQRFVSSATTTYEDQFHHLPNFSNLKTLNNSIDEYELVTTRFGRRPWRDFFSDADFERIPLVKNLKKIRGLESFSCQPKPYNYGLHSIIFVQNIARLEAYLMPSVTAAKPTGTQREAYDSIYLGSRVSQVQSSLLPERFGGRVLRPRSQKKVK